MKKLIFSSLLLLGALPAFSKDKGELLYQNEELYYQNIVECPAMSAADIAVMIKSQEIFKLSNQFIVNTAQKITSNSVLIPSKSDDFEEYRHMTTDFSALSSCKYSGLLTYDIKDNRYRVTLQNIAFQIPHNPIFEKPTILQDVVIKNGVFKKRFDLKFKKYIIHSLNEGIAPRKQNKTLNDNW